MLCGIESRRAIISQRSECILLRIRQGSNTAVRDIRAARNASSRLSNSGIAQRNQISPSCQPIREGPRKLWGNYLIQTTMMRGMPLWMQGLQGGQAGHPDLLSVMADPLGAKGGLSMLYQESPDLISGVS